MYIKEFIRSLMMVGQKIKMAVVNRAHYLTDHNIEHSLNTVHHSLIMSRGSSELVYRVLRTGLVQENYVKVESTLFHSIKYALQTKFFVLTLNHFKLFNSGRIFLNHHTQSQVSRINICMLFSSPMYATYPSHQLLYFFTLIIQR